MSTAEVPTQIRHAPRRSKAFILGIIVAVLLCVVALTIFALRPVERSGTQVKSSSQLRQIGNALDLYHARFSSYPERGADLIDRLRSVYPSVAEHFVSPYPAWAERSHAYLYCSGVDHLSRDAVLAFENPEVDPRGIHILRPDGRVEFVPSSGVSAALNNMKNVQTPDGQPFTLQLPN